MTAEWSPGAVLLGIARDAIRLWRLDDGWLGVHTSDSLAHGSGDIVDWVVFSPGAQFVLKGSREAYRLWELDWDFELPRDREWSA